MTRKQLLWGLVLCPFIAETSSAQLFGPVVTRDADPIAATRAVVGDLTGDFYPDLFQVVSAQKPEVMFAPDMTTAVFTLGELAAAAIDAAIIPASSPGAADQLVITTASGISLIDGYSGGEFTETTYTPSGWAGAKRVFYADFDGDADVDLVGASSGMGTILTLEDAFTGTPTSFSWGVGVNVRDVTVVDWDGDGDSEIATLVPGGVLIWDEQGNFLQVVSRPNDDGFLVPISQSGSAAQRIAVVHKGGAFWAVTVVDAGGAELPRDLSGTDVYAAAAGDVTGDGNDDLVIATRDSNSVDVHYNLTPASKTFGAPSEVVTYGAAGGNTNQNAWPVVADFDNDQDADILIYNDSGDEFAILENGSVDAAAQAPTLDSVTITFDASGQTETTEVEAVFSTSGTDDVELRVFSQPDALSPMIAQPLFVGSAPIVNGTATLLFDGGADPNKWKGRIQVFTFRNAEQAGGGSGLIGAGPVAVATVTLDESVGIANAAEYGVPFDPNVGPTVTAVFVNGADPDGRDVVEDSVDVGEGPPADDPPEGQQQQGGG